MEFLPQMMHGVLEEASPDAASLDENSVVVVGDIHGVVGPLQQILDQTDDTGCTLVFVGDLIDRGPDGCRVMGMIWDRMDDPSEYGYRGVVTVRGNHEDMLLRSRYEKEQMDMWLWNGGQVKDREWLDWSDGWEWMEGFPLVYEHHCPVLFGGRPRRLLVSHASLNPDKDLDNQDPDDLLWNRKVAGFGQDTVCVHGHTPQNDGYPAQVDTATGPVLLIDTGAFFSGYLTGMCFKEVKGGGGGRIREVRGLHDAHHNRD